MRSVVHICVCTISDECYVSVYVLCVYWGSETLVTSANKKNKGEPDNKICMSNMYKKN